MKLFSGFYQWIFKSSGLDNLGLGKILTDFLSKKFHNQNITIFISKTNLFDFLALEIKTECSTYTYIKSVFFKRAIISDGYRISFLLNIYD